MYKRRNDCRFCHKKKLKIILDLGKQPSQGAYLEKDQIGKEKRYPLRLFECQNCGLMQLVDVVKEELFQPYLSSVTLQTHFQEYADEIFDRFLEPGDFVVEFGSNDGVLLKPLQNLGIDVLGIEPDRRIAEIAINRGISTLIRPFSDKIAKEIHRKAKLVLANNVFAHIDNMDEVMRGIDLLLDDGGLFIFEVHNFLNVLFELQFDNIYFEHLNYYTISILSPFLKKYGFEIFEVKPIDTHGGSFRIYTKKVFQNILKDFVLKVKKYKKDFRAVLQLIKNKNKTIIGYGASGRSNTLLNYCGIDNKYLDYIIDESPSRFGRYTPVSYIPIISPEEAKDINNKDYILILAWNYKEQIINKLKDFKGKFIIPLPKIEII